MLPYTATADNVLQAPLKIILLLLGAICYFVGLAPPNSPPPKEGVYKGQPFERAVRLLALMAQTTVISCFLSECAVLLSLYSQSPYSEYVLTTICPGSRPTLSTFALTPSFLFGISTLLIASALRLWCYVTLGSLFTFEVTFKEITNLVTSGPYAYARHPSYTAVLFMLVGAIATILSSGGYVDECHIMPTFAGKCLYLFFTLSTFSTISLWRRGRVEDEGLRKAFGAKWERYRQDVPWMFLPGLF
ncbi:hypothetical protein JB92DRAFT_2810911 [Gautieria morchelliformis]|nr:hypothetical protein JB92DRAFT_2810911 [Gautieria morchelliformis]